MPNDRLAQHAGASLARGLGNASSISWPLRRSSSIFELRYGKALVASSRRPGAVPVYGSNGQTGTHDTPLFAGPGVVLGRKGMGHLGVEWVDRDFWVIDTAYALAPSPEIDLRYAYYLIRHVGLDHLKDGTSNPSLTRDSFSAQIFPIPPMPAQLAIAATLCAFDDKINSNRRTIDVASQLLDAMADELALELPRARLTELAKPNRTTVRPSSLSADLVDHFSLPAFDERTWPDRVDNASIMSNKLLLNERSILISRLNPRFNRTWWAVPDAGFPALASTEFSCLTAETPAGLAGLWLALRDRQFRDELARRVTGTSGSHQRIRPDDILAIDVPDTRQASDAARQKALAVLEMIHVERREIVDLTALRDALLPELLSGRVRAPESEHYESPGHECLQRIGR